MDVSKASLYEHQAGRNGEDQTDTSKIFRIVKEMATGPGRRERSTDEDNADEMEELTMTEVRSRVLAKGFTETQLMDTVLEVCLCSLCEMKRVKLICSTRIWVY